MSGEKAKARIVDYVREVAKQGEPFHGSPILRELGEQGITNQPGDLHEALQYL